MIDKLAFLTAEAIKNLWRHKLTTLTAIFTMCITFFLIGCVFIAWENSHQLIEYLRSKYKIEVFFKNDITDEKAQHVSEQIKMISGVKSATIIFKEDALRIYKNQFNEDLVDMLGYNPLPISCVVNVETGRKEPLNIDKIIAQISAIDAIDQITYLGRLIRKIENAYQFLFTGFPVHTTFFGVKLRIPPILPLLIGGIILIAALIIYNTVQLIIITKRDLIQAMQLIGATNLFIKIPFILEGILAGIIASSITYLALLGVTRGGNHLLNQFSPLKIHLQLNPIIVIWLIGIALVINLFAIHRAIKHFFK